MGLAVVAASVALVVVRPGAVPSFPVVHREALAVVALVVAVAPSVLVVALALVRLVPSVVVLVVVRTVLAVASKDIDSSLARCTAPLLRRTHTAAFGHS